MIGTSHNMQSYIDAENTARSEGFPGIAEVINLIRNNPKLKSMYVHLYSSVVKY